LKTWGELIHRVWLTVMMIEKVSLVELLKYVTAIDFRTLYKEKTIPRKILNYSLH